MCGAMWRNVGLHAPPTPCVDRNPVRGWRSFLAQEGCWTLWRVFQGSWKLCIMKEMRGHLLGLGGQLGPAPTVQLSPW